jgi:glutamate synthase (NADPH) small chain
MLDDSSYRPVRERVQDFREVTHSVGDSDARAAAIRCLDCGVPFCQSEESGCPLGNLIPEWNAYAVEGDWARAIDRLHATNNFPEFTSRLCPAPCESACVRDLEGAAVEIKKVERSIIDHALASGAVKARPPKMKTGKRVAVVGSGPAGLAAAQELARRGHSVTVFEKSDRIGGLLRYGIPDFKMEKTVIDFRIEQLKAEGVVFKTGVEIGRTVSLDEIRQTHDAVALAVGAERPRDLLIKGRELEGIFFAMDYLIAQNDLIAQSEHVALAVHSGPDLAAISAKGLRVVILGGGDTGSDCLGTALRQNAASVQQFEIMPEPPKTRSEKTPWPYWPLKLRSSHAHEEGGLRRFNVTTEEFVGDKGRVTGLKILHENGSAEVIPADLVILALGFTGIGHRLETALGAPGLVVNGRISANAKMETALQGVYAAGDARRGASLIVWAISEGRKMAASIHRQFQVELPL